MTDTTLVTALEDGTGKTAVTVALGLIAQERDRSVGYMKPKGTRLRSRVGKTLDEDPMLAREMLEIDAEMHQLEPIVYSPTFIEGAIRGQEDPAALRDRITDAFAALASDRDCMFVEGGGSVSVGGIVELTDPEVAAALDAQVVLLAGYEEPQDLDDVLAAADTIGDRLAGVLFNSIGDGAIDSLETDAIPFLEGRGVPVLGAIPRIRELAGVTVTELADELGAEVLTETSTDDFVERFIVGAMGPDEALSHFRRARHAAVITGGDRSDIHTAALEAPGVSCLLLTGGRRPSGAVIGTAEDKGVPILSVRSDTLTTIDRAESVVSGGRTRDERTVWRMRELLDDHAEIDTIVER